MLRGNVLAKVDEKGRLKLPASYRAIIEPRYGTEFYVTSLRGDSALIYPMPIFAELEERLLVSSKLEPVVNRLRNVFNYYGQQSAMDGQGRVSIHPLLRERTALTGEVAVLGQQNYLEVWNRNKFEEQLRSAPLTDEDLKELAGLGF